MSSTIWPTTADEPPLITTVAPSAMAARTLSAATDVWPCASYSMYCSGSPFHPPVSFTSATPVFTPTA